MSHPDLLAQLLREADELPARELGLSDVVAVAQPLQARQCAESPDGVHRMVTFQPMGRHCYWCGLLNGCQ